MRRRWGHCAEASDDAASADKAVGCSGDDSGGEGIVDTRRPFHHYSHRAAGCGPARDDSSRRVRDGPQVANRRVEIVKRRIEKHANDKAVISHRLGPPRARSFGPQRCFKAPEISSLLGGGAAPRRRSFLAPWCA